MTVGPLSETPDPGPGVGVSLSGSDAPGHGVQRDAATGETLLLRETPGVQGSPAVTGGAVLARSALPVERLLASDAPMLPAAAVLAGSRAYIYRLLEPFEGLSA